IMVLGYNWDQLSRGARAVISFIPLAIAQALCGWMLGTGRRSAAWREGVGTLLVLALGASLALIAQTYNLGGTWQDFMLTWMLLSLPVVYLLQSAACGMWFMAGITAWLTGSWDHSHVLGFWPLLAAVMPFIVWKIRGNQDGPGVIFLTLTLIICMGIALGFSLSKDIAVLWIQAYAAFFAVLFLIGAARFSATPGAWQIPMLAIGAGGTAIMAFLLTFQWPWHHLPPLALFTKATLHQPATVLTLSIIAALMLAAVALWAGAVRRRDFFLQLYGAFPFMTLLGYALAFRKVPLLCALLFNAYFLALALLPLIKGIKTSRLGLLNVGMLMLMTLILARFFDAKVSLLVKGVTFILAGIVFLTINIVMLKRKRAAQ
ncbi:MAG: DUF2157 domain-containing protein, partial [Lentisphaerae bacterium]|nr:DUF2157 domain-containing protein [Lentisphaerota bacterium]